MALWHNPDSSTPRKGDLLVTIECDEPVLEDRMTVIAYQFAKACQGVVLRRVVKWDLINGCVQFIIGESPANPLAIGEFRTKVEPWA